MAEHGRNLSEGDKIEIVDPDECSYCEVCMDVCPNECIIIEDDF